MPQAEFTALMGLVGLAVGSFFNVCIDRLPLNLSIVAVPSHCERCRHPLSPLDLIPLLSYLWLRGRCRYCKALIPGRIPLVEAVTGILFAYVAFEYRVTLETAVVLAFVGTLIVVFFIDFERSLILNKIIYPGIIVALLVAPLGPLGQGQGVLQSYVDALLGAAVGGGVLFVIFFAALRILGRDAFGQGDVKLGLFLGLVFGLPLTFVALQLSFIAGGLVAIALLAFKVRRRKDTIPFGPFLSGAALITLFWGQAISDWYLELFPV